MNVRRLDHFDCLAVDIRANHEVFQDTLGFRLTEQVVLDDGTEAGMWLTCTNKSYDFAYTRGRMSGGADPAAALVPAGERHASATLPSGR